MRKRVSVSVRKPFVIDLFRVRDQPVCVLFSVMMYQCDWSLDPTPLAADAPEFAGSVGAAVTDCDAGTVGA